MKARLTSITLLFALMSAFVLVPAGNALAKPNKPKKAHPFKGMKAKGNLGNATVAVTEFAVNEAGRLVASGTVTSETRGVVGTFSDAPVTVQQEPGTCEILRLELEELHLNLLGLRVDTSKITLIITADPTGGLLGELLCSLAEFLEEGQAVPAEALNEILAYAGGLSTVTPLTGFLPLYITSFAQENGQIVANFLVRDAAGTFYGPFTAPIQLQQGGECTILNLVIGPLHVNLLGLVIDLYGETPDDPITITISGERGPGNLLGNLICSPTGLLDPNPDVATLNRIVRLLNRILALFD